MVFNGCQLLLTSLMIACGFESVVVGFNGVLSCRLVLNKFNVRYGVNCV